MRRLLWVVLAGCYNPAPYVPCKTQCIAADDCQPGFECGGNGYCRRPEQTDCSPSTIDGPIGPDDDAMGSELCIGQGFITNVCFKTTALPMNDVTAQNSTIDTSGTCDRIITPPAGPPICAMAFRNYTLASGVTVRVIGSRPLAIVATGDITITGTLDARSLLAQAGGGSAGTNAQYCASAAKAGADTTADAAGGGGGAGGALTTTGGSGGGSSGLTSGGATTPTNAVAFVRGGCDGGPGGKFMTSLGGVPGRGGGAVYLLAGNRIVLTGVINASGSGGGGGLARTGGGGGGSGGFIGLDATTFSVSASARVFASGGGGASGGGLVVTGTPGGNADTNMDPGPTASSDANTGIGGAGGSIGGGGGGSSAVNGCGGGGGGGGGGFVGFAGPFVNVSGVFRPGPRQMLPPQ